jgi:hypothetical protein
MGLPLDKSEPDAVLTDALLASHAICMSRHGIVASLLSVFKKSLIDQ